MLDIRSSTPGFSALGNRDGWNPIFRDERTYSLAANVTKLKGRHDLRGGYFVNFMYLDHWQPETGNPRGNFTFNGNTTGLNQTGQPATNFYNQYASFMLGLIGNVNKSVQNELMTAREWQNAHLLPGSVERDREADSGFGDAVGVLPDHETHRRARP